MREVGSASEHANSLDLIKTIEAHMEIHVYDTYVKAKDGHTMHFDVFTAVKDDKKAVEYAKQWLTSIGEGDWPSCVTNIFRAAASPSGSRRSRPACGRTNSPPADSR